MQRKERPVRYGKIDLPEPSPLLAMVNKAGKEAVQQV